MDPRATPAAAQDVKLGIKEINVGEQTRGGWERGMFKLSLKESDFPGAECDDVTELEA